MNIARLFGVVWNLILIVVMVAVPVIVYSVVAGFVGSITSAAAFQRGFMIFLMSGTCAAGSVTFTWPFLWQLRWRG